MLDLLRNKEAAVESRIAAALNVGREGQIGGEWPLADTINDWSEPLVLRLACVDALALHPAARSWLYHCVPLASPRGRHRERWLLRAKAVQHLRELGYDAGARGLMLREDRPSLLKAVTQGGYSPSIVEAAVRQVESDEPAMVSDALAALAYSGELGPLREALGRLRDPEDRAYAIELIGGYSVGEAGDLEAVASALQDRSEVVVRRARKAAKALGLKVPAEAKVRRMAPKENSPVVHALYRSAHVVMDDAAMSAELDVDDFIRTSDGYWMGNRGASDAALQRLERRLGQPLPPSYRRFLRMTDGWPRLSGSVGRLRSADEIDRIGVVRKDWVDEHFNPAEGAGVSFEQLKRCVLISDDSEGDIVLLTPDATLGDEWGVVAIAQDCSVVDTYGSFEDFVIAETEPKFDA